MDKQLRSLLLMLEQASVWQQKQKRTVQVEPQPLQPVRRRCLHSVDGTLSVCSNHSEHI